MIRGHHKAGCQEACHPCEEGQVVLDNKNHDTKARYNLGIDREGHEVLDEACNMLEEEYKFHDHLQTHEIIWL